MSRLYPGGSCDIPDSNTPPTPSRISLTQDDLVRLSAGGEVTIQVDGRPVIITML